MKQPDEPTPSPVFDVLDLSPRMQAGAQPQRLVMSLFGTHWGGGDVALPSAALVALSGDFGVTEASARIALARLTKRGLLRLERNGRNTSYGLTDDAQRLLHVVQARIDGFGASHERWDGRWRCVAFTIAGDANHLRHLLRERLRGLGFAPLYDGLWVSPHDRTAQVVAALEQLKVNAATVFVADHVDSSWSRNPIAAWDLDAIRKELDSYLSRFDPVLQAAIEGRIAPAEAMVRLFEAADDWLALSLGSAELPDELLPAEWPRNEARALFDELGRRLGPLSAMRVRDALTESDPALARHVRTVHAAESFRTTGIWT